MILAELEDDEVRVMKMSMVEYWQKEAMEKGLEKGLEKGTRDVVLRLLW